MTTETHQQTHFTMLPIEELNESALNPRKYFDPVKLKELTDSVRAKGVITPLLVRPAGDIGYEIAAGHRRFRAALAAELVEVPAVVRVMDDVDFLEVLIMENDEREDLHPLEEADGYRTLMTKAGYTVERIAERRGCSVKYVYDRVKLLQLIPEAQKLFRENKFTAGHAILLARLTPADQRRAIGTKDDDYLDGGLFETEESLFDPNDEDETEAPLKVKSVREFEAWIAGRVRFDTKAVDQVLFPETAETLFQAQAQHEKVVHITHEHHVRPEARGEGRILGPRSWTRADGQYGTKSCDYAVVGVVVVGPEHGSAFRVCTAKDRCTTHWAEEQKAREKARRAGASTTAVATKDRYALEQAKRQAEQAKRDALEARWKKATPKILEAIAAAVNKAPTKADGLLADIVLAAVTPTWAPKTSEALVPRGEGAEDVVRRAAFIVLAHEVASYAAHERFPKRAKAFNVDVAKILDEAAPPPKAEAAAAGKKPAPKAAKKKGAKK